eukprot:9457778-Pyramimonas_sp.AAC.1
MKAEPFYFRLGVFFGCLGGLCGGLGGYPWAFSCARGSSGGTDVTRLGSHNGSAESSPTEVRQN